MNGDNLSFLLLSILALLSSQIALVCSWLLPIRHLPSMQFVLCYMYRGFTE